VTGPRPVLVVEHEARCPPGLIAAPLGAVARVVRPYLGEALPAGTADLGGLVVLGGTMGALDDDAAPWLPAVRSLLVDAVRRSTPTLGVCLGAQLLGAACGGRVERGPAGPETGVVRLARTGSTDPFADALPADGLVAQCHDDAVTVLPPDAELLAAGDLYPHQMFRVGAAAWAVQYHPEATPEVYADWLAARERRAPEQAARARTSMSAHPGVVGRQATADAHVRALLVAVTAADTVLP
jgi:GMP synthase (glutamine-hydrolysing)